MKTAKINPLRVRIVPTKKKFENAQRFAQTELGESGLPKGEPVDKGIYIIPMSHEFERIKDTIRASIERMRGF